MTPYDWSAHLFKLTNRWLQRRWHKISKTSKSLSTSKFNTESTLKLCDGVCYKRESKGEVNTLTPLFESTGIRTDR